MYLAVIIFPIIFSYICCYIVNNTYHVSLLFSLFLDKPSDVLCYTVSPRGVGTHDVDEWLASWSPRVEMERKSKQQRLLLEKEKQRLLAKSSGRETAGDTVRKWGYTKHSSPSLLASISTPGDDVNVRTVNSGSALRAEIEKSETLGYLKAALVPSNGK